MNIWFDRLSARPCTCRRSVASRVCVCVWLGNFLFPIHKIPVHGRRTLRFTTIFVFVFPAFECNGLFFASLFVVSLCHLRWEQVDKRTKNNLEKWKFFAKFLVKTTIDCSLCDFYFSHVSVWCPWPFRIHRTMNIQLEIVKFRCNGNKRGRRGEHAAHGNAFDFTQYVHRSPYAAADLQFIKLMMHRSICLNLIERWQPPICIECRVLK